MSISPISPHPIGARVRAPPIPMAGASVDTKGIKRFEKDLRKLNRKGFPYAVKATLDSVAFDARKQWQGEIQERFTLRNRYTVSSIRVEKAKGRNVSSMHSTVGSVADYMEHQEERGETRRGGKYGPPVPTLDARSGKSEKRPVARPNKLSRIQLGARGLSKFSTKRQKIAVAASMAARSGSKYVMLPIAGSEGIYKLSGSARRPRMRMIWSMSNASVRIPPQPTMKPAVQQSMKRTSKHYEKALKFQLMMAKTWKR